MKLIDRSVGLIASFFVFEFTGRTAELIPKQDGWEAVGTFNVHMLSIGCGLFLLVRAAYSLLEWIGNLANDN